jgi:hypothetical protein
MPRTVLQSSQCCGSLQPTVFDAFARTGAAKPSAVEAAKSQLQWLADGLQRSFEAERDNPNPFSLQCVLYLVPCMLCDCSTAP